MGRRRAPEKGPGARKPRVRIRPLSDGKTRRPAVDDVAMLRALLALVDERKMLDLRIGETVDQLRAAGHTWERIAIALDVTKQAAWRKYGA